MKWQGSTPNLGQPLGRRNPARTLHHSRLYPQRPTSSTSIWLVVKITLKDPNNGPVGPKYFNVIGIWALEPYYSGHWTLRESYGPVSWTQGITQYRYMFSPMRSCPLVGGSRDSITTYTHGYHRTRSRNGDDLRKYSLEDSNSRP